MLENLTNTYPNLVVLFSVLRSPDSIRVVGRADLEAIAADSLSFD